MGNQMTDGSHQLQNMFSRFEVVHSDPEKNLVFMKQNSTNELFTLRQITTNDEIQKKNIEDLALQKITMNFKQLWKLESFIMQKQKNYCSNQYKAYLLFKTPAKDLRELIHEKRNRKAQFSETQIVNIIQNVVLGLKYLNDINHPHEAICSTNIFLDTQGEIYLSDPWLNAENIIYPSTNHIYLSPQKLQEANNLRLQIIDWFLSDLFSLGMVILEAINLEFMDDIYQRNNKQINMDKLQQKISRIKSTKIKRYLSYLLGQQAKRIIVVREISNQGNKTGRTSKTAQSTKQFIQQLPKYNSYVERPVKSKPELQPNNYQIHNSTSKPIPLKNQNSANFTRNIVSINKLTYKYPEVNNLPINYQTPNQPIQRPLVLQNRIRYEHDKPNIVYNTNYVIPHQNMMPNAEIKVRFLNNPTYSNPQTINNINTNRTIPNLTNQPVRNFYKKVQTPLSYPSNNNFIPNPIVTATSDFKILPQTNINSSIQEVNKSNQMNSFQSTYQSLDAKKQQPKIQYSNINQKKYLLSYDMESNKIQNQFKSNSPKIDEQTTELKVSTPARKPTNTHKYNSTIQQESESEHSPSSVNNEIEYVVQQYDIGSKYQGYKKNGMRNGKGIFYYQDGGYYEGEWKDNKMHGYGKLFYNNTKIAYEGDWYMDEFHGYGKVYNDDPVLLNNPFNYYNFDELEEFWVYYQGNLVGDTKEGIGRICLSNGEIFEGEFHRDRIHGKGKFTTREGVVIEGLWKDSRLIKTY